MTDNGKAITVLTLNTLAFTVCFACWMMNGVLITFLVNNRVLDLDKAQMGWLIGIPVLTGSLMRLPIGVLTDKYGGRVVYGILMLISAVPMYLTSTCHTYSDFMWASLGFGLSGASFAVGIAYTSIWFPKERQGTVLGIFGMGNAGAAITSLLGPTVLNRLTDNAQNMEGWRTYPKIYAGALVLMAIVFLLFTHSKKVQHGQELGLMARLAPLKHVRVWRFGLYYFFVFGGFVGLAQWLIPYYVGAYGMQLATAGLLATAFNLPSGLTRSLGGVLSDKYGARSVMYWVFGTSLLCCIFLFVPKMDIESPGEAVMAFKKGKITTISEHEIVIDDETHYKLKPRVEPAKYEEGMLVLPKFAHSQEIIEGLKVGDVVKPRQLLARGTTHIYFQANVWIFTFLVFALAIVMGLGMAAVYKYIPDYFPKEVGVVGGIVGVIGGLGGFFFPIIFGYLLKSTGIWTTCWMFFFVLVFICHTWLHMTVRRMLRERAPILSRQIEDQKLVQEVIGTRG